MKACVDIGGTKIAVSLAEDGARRDGQPGPLLGRISEPTAKTGDHTAVAQQILRMIDAVCASQGVAVSAIERVGVSSTGPIVRRDGAIELATPNICGGLAGAAHRLPNDWTTAPVEAPLAARFRTVRVENDAVGALEAERRWGALQGVDDCAYVTWSTGIGAGVCVDGRVLRGKNGNAGHAGHSFVVSDERDALCGCGNVGDIEGLASGTAIERRFGRPANELLSAADAGDAGALAQVDGLCGMVGRLLYNLIVTLDLERISLGGSVFLNHQALLLPRLRAQIDGRLPALTAGVSLHAAGLGERVGDYAALALFD